MRQRPHQAVAVGGQLISVRGLAGEYTDLFLPLYGTHQAHNAALAIAAVESFLGRGTQPLVPEVLAGVIAVMAIALIVDGLLVLLGRALMPWAPRRRRLKLERTYSGVALG